MPTPVCSALRRLAAPLALAGTLILAAPASATTVTMAAAGDIACQPSANTPTPVTCQQGATAQAIEAMNPAFVAALGDNQYDLGSLSEFMSVFNPTWGRFKDRIYPTPGNHEWKSPGAAGYFDYFGARAGERGKGWYSYQAGDWHVIVLDSQCDAVGCGAGSEQDRWLRADLAAHRKESCTLAYFHHPPFSGGQTQNDPNDIAARSLFATLYGAHVDLLLTAHDHSYQRFAPLDPAGNADRALGLREIVVGTGGDNFHTFQSVAPNTESRDDKTFGVLQVTLNSRDYAWQFRPVAGGTFVDSGTDGCHRVPAVLHVSLRRARLARALRRGLRATVTADRSARIKATATVKARTARRVGLGRRRTKVASGRATAQAGRRAHAKLKFTRRARRALKRARRVTLSVRVTATTTAGRKSRVTRRITLR